MDSDTLLAIADGHWPAHSGWPAYNRESPAIVAVHEAGHLVATLALGAHATDADFVAVSEGDHGMLCRVRDGKRAAPPSQVRGTPYPCEHDADDQFRRMVLERVAVYLAGRAAELVALGFELRGWPRALLDTDDGRSAVLFAGLCWDKRVDGPLAAAWMLADGTLRQHWPWVIRVASLIEQAGQCSKTEALLLRDANAKQVRERPPEDPHAPAQPVAIPGAGPVRR